MRRGRRLIVVMLTVACLAGCAWPGKKLDTMMIDAVAPPPPLFLTDAPDEVRNGVPVNFTQAKSGRPLLPNPLVTAKGKAVKSAHAWYGDRRAAVLALLEQNQEGRTPGVSYVTRYEFLDRGTPVFEGAAVRRQTRIHLLNANGSAEIDVATYAPTQAPRPAPVLLNLGFSPNILAVDDPGIKDIEVWRPNGTRTPGRKATSFGKFDVAAAIRRGYGVALVYYGQIEPDFTTGRALGVRALFAPQDAASRPPDDWGAVGAWAWGASRVVDYLQTDPAFDPKRIALQGVSRLGKAALWAGAQDTRIALVIASCSGEGGAALSRRNYGETIAHIMQPASFAYWFAPRWAAYAQNPGASPVDSHFLLSLIAPRPLLLITAEKDAWSDPYGEYLAARAASPVYKLLGKEGLGNQPFPELNRATRGDLAVFVHAGGHGSVPQDMGAVLDFMDAKLTRSGPQG